MTVTAAKVPVTGVTLDQEELTLAVGATETLTATVAPDNATDKTVTWKSGKESVATVDQKGKVTAVGQGTTTITVTTKDGEKEAYCKVTVTAAKVPVTGVTLDQTELTLAAGESETLTATVAPDNATNKELAWKSSDQGIAKVDGNGKVTALKEGTATITVTTKDGNKTATCKVTVTAAKVPVTGVALDQTQLELEAGESETLTATVAPDNATDKAVTWTTSDKNIATVDKNGKVTAVKEGTATITVTTKDGSKKAECKVTVTAPPPDPPEPPEQPEPPDQPETPDPAPPSNGETSSTPSDDEQAPEAPPPAA